MIETQHLMNAHRALVVPGALARNPEWLFQHFYFVTAAVLGQIKAASHTTVKKLCSSSNPAAAASAGESDIFREYLENIRVNLIISVSKNSIYFLVRSPMILMHTYTEDRL